MDLGIFFHYRSLFFVCIVVMVHYADADAMSAVAISRGLQVVAYGISSDLRKKTKLIVNKIGNVSTQY